MYFDFCILTFFVNLNQRPMKKKVPLMMLWFFTLLLLFSFQGWAQAEFEVTTLLDKTGVNLPAQIGTGGNARSAALYQDRYVIVVSREGGQNVWVWDSQNPGAAPFALPMGTDIINTTITFPINYVRVAGDAIYVSNLTLNPTGTGWGQGPFYVYRWTSLTSEPEVVINYTVAAGRLGDAFSIIGDPMADGHIIAHMNTTKEFRVWTFEDGVLTNHDTPGLITLNVPETHINNHGIYNSIPGEESLFVVTSNNKGIMIANLNGEILAEMGTEIIDMRSYDPNIFYLGGKRYLTYTLNNEANAEVGARYQVVDISEGATVIEAIEAIVDSDVLAAKIVHDFVISPTGHANLTSTNSVGVLEDGTIRILAHVVGKGFVMEEFSAASAVYFTEDFNDGNAASRWSFAGTGGTNVVDFAFDYETAGIPLIGEETNGIGLKMAVNTVSPGLISAAMAFPNGQSFEGEYVLSFDFWMNFEGTTGTTEHAIFGVGHSSTDIQTPTPGTGSVDGTPGTGPSNNGIDYTMTPDNGASRDVRVFVDGAELLGAAGGFAGDLQSTQTEPYNDAYVGTEPGNQWLAIAIEVLADRTIFKVNGHVWAETMAVADPGNIMLGYIDFFGGSVANEFSYIVFDNIKVGEKVEEPPLARVQLIHNSADAAVALVDLYADGELQLEDVAFRTATPFMDAPAGVDINLVITPANAPIEQGVPVTVNFTDGMTYVVVAAGNVSTEGYEPDVPFGLYVYEFGQEAAVNPANTDVLVFHGSTDAPTVTVWETGVGVGQIISDFSFGDFAGYLSLPLNNYVLEIRDESGANTVAAYSAPLATLGLQGEALTVLASGFLNPASNSDGPAFGLYAALAAGGALVELPFYDDTVIIDEFPYVQDFEGEDFPPAGWNIVNPDGTAIQWLLTNSSNHTPEGEYATFHNYNGSANEDGWLISPAMVIPADAEFLLSFWSVNQYPSYYGKNSVLISTGSANPADEEFVEVWTTPTVVNAWVETTIDLTDFAGQTIYVAFRYEGEDAHVWILDDIRVGEEVVVPQFETLFEFSVAGGDIPSWMGTNNERGIASYGDKVYAVSRTGGNFVYVLDRLTGEVTGQLNTTGIQPVGTFHINDIEASDDGVIVASNMAMGAGATFLLYEMDETEPVNPILQFTLPAEGGRIGDKITLVGSFSDGGATLYAADASNPKVYKWTLTDGVFGTPEVITLEIPHGNTPVVSPLPDGTFYYTAAGQGLSKLNADGTLIGSVAGEIIPTGSTAIKYFGKDGNDEMVGVYLYGENHEHLVVVRVVDGDPALAETEFVTPSMYGAANANGTGDVAFEPAADGVNADLYVLGSNNGIGGYRSLFLDLVFPDYSVQEPGDQFILHWDVASTANTIAYRAEHYSVLISNTGPEPENFVTVWEETLSTDVPGWEYRPRQVDISDYAGDDIYVAFRHHNVTDMDRIVLDNVKIVMIPEEGQKEELVVFHEDFQGGVVEEVDEEWMPEGWTKVDSDGDDFNWYYGVRISGEVTQGAMRSESWDSVGEVPLTPDNWLFTPSITLVEPVPQNPMVTFNVNMTYAEGFDPASDIVYITGSLLGWAEPGTDPDNQTMTRVDDSMVWTKTFELEAGTYAYKYFLNAGWGGGEWQGGADRSITVEGDMVVNDWFGYLTDPTSVIEVDASQLKLFPNPARTTLTIVSGDMIRELRMIDMLGQVVYAADVVGESHQINVASFRNGIYFIQILTAKGLTTHRVQIQR